MSFVLILNNVMYHIDFDKYYNALFLIDLRKYLIECDIHNTIFFFIRNPRVNIQLISAYFEFYFQRSPESYMLGQVISKTLISYRICSSIHISMDTDYLPCILFTKGLLLQEILIYMPSEKISYLRELHYYFFPRSLNKCCVCLDIRPDVMNIHQDRFHHSICSECILRIQPPLCPICRLTII